MTKDALPVECEDILVAPRPSRGPRALPARCDLKYLIEPHSVTGHTRRSAASRAGTGEAFSCSRHRLIKPVRLDQFDGRLEQSCETAAREHVPFVPIRDDPAVFQQ